MRHIQIFLCVLVQVLLIVSVASASSGDSGQQTPVANLVWRLLNIAIVIGIIWKLAGKKISELFTGRRAGIAKELDDLESRKEKARQDLMDVEKRIANLEAERVSILADYEVRGEALKVEIIAKAEQSAVHIIEQARQTAQNEVDDAVKALREELAEKIVDAATKSIVGSLSTKDQEKLLNSFLNKVVLQ